jgi:hypothetical protein
MGLIGSQIRNLSSKTAFKSRVGVCQKRRHGAVARGVMLLSGGTKRLSSFGQELSTVQKGVILKIRSGHLLTLSP